MIIPGNHQEIKLYLDLKYTEYNCLEFIHSDPIQVPHRYSRKEDIEIAAFLTATISWGQRKSIINNANRLMDLMDDSPYEFLMEKSNFSEGYSHSKKILNPDSDSIADFVHRTFNSGDCLFFFESLQNIYRNYNGLEDVLTTGFQLDGTIYSALKHLRNVFLSIPHADRIRKHIPDVTANSSAKRLNMLLRWMVRKDENNIDFGLWKDIPSSALMLPLDVHSGNTARKLGLLHRKQNDWKAVEEITSLLRLFDPLDPTKYDFALFGAGAFEG
jgi:uncharacterized protein (TIGR02757 family)